MFDVIQKLVEIKDADKDKYSDGLPGKSYDALSRTLKFRVNRSTSDKAFRLVHDGSKVIMFQECNENSVTETIHNMICGTEEECQNVIDTLKLDPEVSGVSNLSFTVTQ